METTKRIYNGNIVTPDEIIENGTIVLKGNSIVDIERQSVHYNGMEDVDAGGMWVLPGLIDTHSDAIEQEVQPRPTSIMPIASAFYELERRLAGQGITTMYHSLSMYYTDNEGEWIRRNENVNSIIKEIHNMTNEESLIRNKIHLRYEMKNSEAYPLIENMIKAHKIDQISFMDHTPGKGQWHDIGVQKKKIMKRLNLTSEEADIHIKKLQENTNINFSKIQDLAELSFEYGIPLASHDDDTIEKIDVLDAWKARISEFPISLEVAREAKRRGFHVVVGAPNLLLGRSHNNNLSSLEAIKAGVVDILCSDYYPGSLLQGIFFLRNQGFSIIDAVRLATLNPATALGLSDVGSIEVGKRADLLIVAEEEGIPKLFKTIVDGEVVSQIQYRQTKIHVGE